MIVADLQQHLTDLAKLLEANKAASAAKDLQTLGAALAPFKDQSPTDFTRFLALAHEYHTTGKLTAPTKAARLERRSRRHNRCQRWRQAGARRGGSGRGGERG